MGIVANSTERISIGRAIIDLQPFGLHYLRDNAEAVSLHLLTAAGLYNLSNAALTPNMSQDLRIWMAIGAASFLATGDIIRMSRTPELKQLTQEFIEQGPTKAIKTYFLSRCNGDAAMNFAVSTSLALGAAVDLRDVDELVKFMLFIPASFASLWTGVRSFYHGAAAGIHGLLMLGSAALWAKEKIDRG